MYGHVPVKSLSVHYAICSAVQNILTVHTYVYGTQHTICIFLATTTYMLLSY